MKPQNAKNWFTSDHLAILRHIDILCKDSKDNRFPIPPNFRYMASAKLANGESLFNGHIFRSEMFDLWSHRYIQTVTDSNTWNHGSVLNITERGKKRLLREIHWARIQARQGAVAYPHSRSIKRFRYYQALDINSLNISIDNWHWRIEQDYKRLHESQKPSILDRSWDRDYTRRSLSDAQEAVKFCEIVKTQKLESLYQEALKEAKK